MMRDRSPAPDERAIGVDRGDRPGSDGEHELQAQFGTIDRADPFYDEAMHSSLTDRMRSFLGERWLGFVGWMTDEGPRLTTAVGEPGMIRRLGDETIAWPAECLLGAGPALDGPRAQQWLSLVTVDWWDSTVGLHVNGIAGRYPTIPGDDDAETAGDWIVLVIEEAYIHCAKHIPRLTVAERAPTDRSAGSRTIHDDRLTPATKQFIDSRLLGVLATADRHGETDVSPRLGPDGFVQVVDDTTIAWPEYRGNGIHASLGNIYEQPAASMSFIDWWNGEAIVHVAGDASIHEEVAGAVDLTDIDRTKSWVALDVDSVTVHVDPPVPQLSIEAFDPPWGTDDQDAKKTGFFME